MNTTTTSLRLTAAASVVALAVTLAGCAGADAASIAGESRAHAASQVVVTPAMHRALVRAAADRYVSELLVRHRMAQARALARAAADRYVNELLVRHHMATQSPTASVDVILTPVSGRGR